ESAAAAPRSTALCSVVLAVIFSVWYRVERTLSIHSIRTPRRELFYWATVLATFALGTATGDLTARVLSLGYLASGIWFSVAFAGGGGGALEVRPEPDPGLLDLLRADSAGGSLVRRLGGVPDLGRRPGRGARAGRPVPDVPDRHLRRLPGGDPQGRRGGSRGGTPVGAVRAPSRRAAGSGVPAHAAPAPAGRILRPGRLVALGARRIAGRLSEGSPKLRHLCPATHSPWSSPMSSRFTAAS